MQGIIDNIDNQMCFLENCARNKEEETKNLYETLERKIKENIHLCYFRKKNLQ